MTHVDQRLLLAPIQTGRHTNPRPPTQVKAPSGISAAFGTHTIKEAQARPQHNSSHPKTGARHSPQFIEAHSYLIEPHFYVIEGRFYDIEAPS